MERKGADDNASPGLVANSRWNLVAFAVSLAAQFVTVPFVVRWIGLEAFGIAAVVLAICAPMALIGTVLGQALIREISSNRLDNRDHLISSFTAAAMRMCLLTCAVGWVALVVLGSALARPLINVENLASEIWLTVLIAATGAIAQQVVLVLQGVSAAQQDYRTIAQVTLFTALVTCISTLSFTWAWPHENGYLIGVAFGFVFGMLAWVQRWWTVIAWKRVFSMQSSDETAALIKFSKWQGVAQLAGVLGNQIDRYALGAMTAISIVGQYAVANRLQEAAYIGVIKAGEVLFPRFGTMARRNVDDRLMFFQSASWVLGTLSAVMLVPLAVLSTSVLTLWVGPQATIGADRMLFVLVLGGIVGSASNVFTYYAMGIGRNAPVAGISVLFSVLTVLMTIILIATFGPLAAGLGLLLASCVRVFVSMSLTRRLFFPGLGWDELFVSSVLPAMVGLVIALGGRHAVVTQPVGWLDVALHYAVLSATVFAVGVFVTGVTPPGRRIIIRLVQPFLGFR